MITNYMSMVVCQMEKAALRVNPRAFGEITGALRTAEELRNGAHEVPSLLQLGHSPTSAAGELGKHPFGIDPSKVQDAEMWTEGVKPSVAQALKEEVPTSAHAPEAAAPDASAGGMYQSVKDRADSAFNFLKEKPWQAAGVGGGVLGAGWLGHHTGYDDGGHAVGQRAWQQGLQAGGEASRQAADKAGFLSRIFGDGGQGNANNMVAKLGGPQMTQDVVNHILSQS